MTDLDGLSLWDAPAEDITVQRSLKTQALAREAIEPLWPYLSSAGSVPEFEARLATATPNIDSMLARVITDPSLKPDEVRVVATSGLSQRFAEVLSQREVDEAAQRLSAALQAEAGGVRKVVYQGSSADQEFDHTGGPTFQDLRDLVGKYVEVIFYNEHGVGADYETGRFTSVRGDDQLGAAGENVEWSRDGSGDSYPIDARDIYRITRLEEPDPVGQPRLFAAKEAGGFKDEWHRGISGEFVNEVYYPVIAMVDPDEEHPGKWMAGVASSHDGRVYDDTLVQDLTLDEAKTKALEIAAEHFHDQQEDALGFHGSKQAAAQTCGYDSGSMYGNTGRCGKPAVAVVHYHNGTSGPLSEPVCQEHLGPMQGRVYPGLDRVEKIASLQSEAAGGQADYEAGYALGTKHRERGKDYSLPFGKHVDWIKGYKDGHEGKPSDAASRVGSKQATDDKGAQIAYDWGYAKGQEARNGQPERSLPTDTDVWTNEGGLGGPINWRTSDGAFPRGFRDGLEGKPKQATKQGGWFNDLRNRLPEPFHKLPDGSLWPMIPDEPDYGLFGPDEDFTFNPGDRVMVHPHGGSWGGEPTGGTVVSIDGDKVHYKPDHGGEIIYTAPLDHLTPMRQSAKKTEEEMEEDRDSVEKWRESAPALAALLQAEGFNTTTRDPLSAPTGEGVRGPRHNTQHIPKQPDNFNPKDPAHGGGSFQHMRDLDDEYTNRLQRKPHDQFSKMTPDQYKQYRQNEGYHDASVHASHDFLCEDCGKGLKRQEAFQRGTGHDRPAAFCRTCAGKRGWLPDPLALQHMEEPHQVHADRTGPTIDSAEGYEYTPAPEWVQNACRHRFEGGGTTALDPKNPGHYLHGVGNWWDGPSEVKDNGDHTLSYRNPYNGDTDRFDESGYFDADGTHHTWGSQWSDMGTTSAVQALLAAEGAFFHDRSHSEDRQPPHPQVTDERGEFLRKQHQDEAEGERESEQRHDDYWAAHPEEHERFLRNNAVKQASGPDGPFPNYDGGPFEGLTMSQIMDKIHAFQAEHGPHGTWHDMLLEHRKTHQAGFRDEMNRVTGTGVCKHCGQSIETKGGSYWEVVGGEPGSDLCRANKTGRDAGEHKPGGKKQAVNESAEGTERYQAQPTITQPDWTVDAWGPDGQADKHMTEEGRAAYEKKDSPFKDTLTTVRQAALKIADMDPGEDGGARTTRPRQIPKDGQPNLVTVETEIVPGQMGGGGSFDMGYGAADPAFNAGADPTAQVADPMAPSVDQMVAAKVARLAKRVLMDNPSMSEQDARRLAAQTVATYPEMVKVQR